ncbi:hypothetical protein SEA_MARKY_58 [Streptomyces phage Marky]|nr:hypothetical protein SEA_MARKY_58 [Streptomyces phage Marky]
MPKLPDEVVDAPSNENSGDDFQPLKAGRYVMRLVEVEEGETGEHSKNPGTPKFVYVLQVDKDYHPELRKGRWGTRVSEHVPCTAAMKWKHEQIMNAFGYTVDSDTDEIIEDADARCVMYSKIGTDIKDPEKKVTEAKRYVKFDASKFTYSPEDEDDNQ